VGPLCSAYRKPFGCETNEIYSWEQNVPKSGHTHDRVVDILNRRGLTGYAANQKDLRNAVVGYLGRWAYSAATNYHVQSMNLWNQAQALSNVIYPPPDGDVLDYNSNSSRPLLPYENRADVTFVTGDRVGADGTEVVGDPI
jgi:hypothetical protein